MSNKSIIQQYSFMKEKFDVFDADSKVFEGLGAVVCKISAKIWFKQYFIQLKMW